MGDVLGYGDQDACLPEEGGLVLDPADSAEVDFYRQQYLAPVESMAGALDATLVAALAQNYHSGVPQLTRSERVLSRIWRLSRKPAVSRLVSIVPFRVQQALKRRLSRRPMHDIIR